MSLICTRRSIRTGRPCRREAAGWPGQRLGPGQPSPDWPDLPPVVACWTHLSEDERAMCLEARRRYNEAVQKEWAADREQQEREAAERRAAGIPDPEPDVYEPRPCVGGCISEQRATGRDSDSAMGSCARCDGYVCVECGEAPAEYLFGCCEKCEKITPYDGAEFEADYVNASSELRATLNTLVGQLVAAGGLEYPHVQAELNRRMHVPQRRYATEPQLRRGLEYAERWLDRLRQEQPGPSAVSAPRDAAESVGGLTAAEVVELRRLIVDAKAVLSRLGAFEKRLAGIADG